jgi:tetratricopeptide (TPR) repeat protein
MLVADENGAEAGALPGTVIELLLERAERSDSADARATLLAHVARLYEYELGDADRAFTALLAAESERDQDHAPADLERLAGLSGRWADLAAHIERRLPEPGSADCAERCAWLGAVFLDHLDDAERALLIASAVLASEPGHERASTVRLGALRKLDRKSELTAALGVAALASWDGERRVDLFVEQARLLMEAGAGAQAKEACRAALDADPLAAEARTLLERLVRESDDLGELIELLDAKARDAAADEALKLRREAAALCANRGRTDDAVRRYEEIRAEVSADLETLWALERIHAGVHPREHLLVLAALAGAISDDSERLALNRRLAAGWEALGEPGRAADALEWVLASDGGDDEAYARLAALYRADGRWRAAVVAITRRLERSDVFHRAALYVELGQLYEEHAEDYWCAIDYYENANELAPGVEGTLVALGRLYELTVAHERAAKRLEEAARVARTASARAGRLTRAGELLTIDGDEARRQWAERLLREALAAQPGYPPASRALARLHLGRGEGRSAADLLAGAVASAADDDERADLLLEAGRVEESLGEEERALSCYRRALEADPSRRDAQVCTSDMLYRLGFDQEVIPLFERLCEDEPDAAVRADRLVRLARVYEAIGDRRRAFEAVHHAQAVAKGHLAARRLEGDLLYAEGRWQAARVLFETVFAEAEGLTSRELANLQARIGACAAAVADSKSALIALEQALRLNPDHLGALKRALELYAEQGRWLDALGAAERIAALEPEKKLRARYLSIAGRICVDELHAVEDAVAHYRAALDEDPELDPASLAIEHLLSVQGDSEGLVAHCTRRIQQLGAAGDAADGERVRLWAVLADACEAMGDKDAQRVALEVATRLDGTRLDLRERYAAACAQRGVDQLDRAISEHREILARDKARVSSYLALADLHARTGDPLRAAACHRAAMTLEALAARVTVPALAEIPNAARRPLGTGDWARLRHADEDPRLSALWARIAPILAALEAVPHRSLGLHPRDAVHAEDARPFAEACREAGRLLGVSLPELYVRHDQRQAMSYLNARSEHTLAPVFLIGTPLLGDRRRTHDLLFPIALRLANLSGERLLRLALPDANALAVIIDAVIALAREADGKGSAAWSRIGQALRQHLTPLGFDQAVAVGRVLAERGEEPRVLAQRWLRGADLTAARAALVLSGDLSGAMRVLASGDPPSYAEPNERMLDLIWFSTTDAFVSVRARVADARELAHSAPRPQLQAI